MAIFLKLKAGKQMEIKSLSLLVFSYPVKLDELDNIISVNIQFR